MNLCLGSNGELFIIDLERVCFFQADDHYAVVYYDTHAHFMIPFGLSKLDEHIQRICMEDKFLIRIGRKYIINLRKVFYINLLRKEVQLTSIPGKHFVIHISKEALKLLMYKVKEGKNLVLDQGVDEP